MSTIYDDDVFVVESNGQQYNVQNQNRSSLSDDDLFLVERNGTLYKVAASDVGTGGGEVTGSFETPVQVLTPLNGAGLNDGEAYEPISSPITAVGAAGSETYTTSDITTVTEVRENLVVSTNGTLTPQNIFDGRWDTSTGTNTGACVTNFENMKVPSLHSVFVRCLGGSNSSTGTTTITFVGGGSSTISQPGTAGITNIYRNDTAEDVFLEKITQSRKSGSWAYFDAIAIVPDSAGLPTSKGQIVEIADVQPYTAMWGPSGLSRDGTELTFENSTNFDKFQVGDVVQASDFIFPFQTTDLSNSAGPTGVVTNPANAYDGDLTKGALGGGATTWVQFNLDPYGINVKTGDVVTVYLRNEFLIGNTGNIGDTILKFVDGSEITGTGVSGTDPVEHIDLIVDGQKTIQYIKHYTTNSNTRQPAISGIALNGMLLLGEDYKDKTDLVSVVSVDDPNSQMLVDGGEWSAFNNSQVWSSPPIFTDNGNGAADGYPISNAFDGDLDTRALPVEGGTWTLNFADNFTDIKKVELGIVAKGTGVLSVNDSPQTVDAGTQDLTLEIANLAKIDFTWVNTQNYCYLKYIKVDGALLVDQGVLLPSESSLSKTVSYDASLTCSSSTELANMVGPITMTDENGDLKTPQTSEIVSVNTVTIDRTVTRDGGQAWTSIRDNEALSPESKIAFEVLSEGASITSNVVYLRCYPATTAKANWIISDCPVFNDDDDIGIYFRKYVESDRSMPFIVDGIEIGPGTYDSSDGNASGTKKGRPWSFKGSDFPNNTIGKLEFEPNTGGGSAQFGFAGITINGEWLASEVQTELTFADSTDLEYFSAGDVLQNRDPAGSAVPDAVNNPWSLAFDGIISTGGTGHVSATNDPNVISVYTFDNPVTGVVTMTVYGLNNFDDIYVNGTAIGVTTTAYGAPMVVDPSLFPDGVVRTIGLSGNGNGNTGRLTAVEINGELLTENGSSVSVVSVDPDNSQMVVNGGTWDTANRSEVWSNYLVVTPGSLAGAELAFNGNPGNTSETAAETSGSNFMVFTPPTPIQVNQSIKIFGGSADDRWQAEINGVETDYVDVPTGEWQEIFSGSGTLTFIRGRDKSLTSNKKCRLGAIEIDGKQLIDATLNGEVWSSTEFCTQGAEGDGGYSSDRAFSGELIGEQVWYPPQNGEAKFITGDRFDSATKLEFSYSRLGGGPTLKVNNNTLNLAEGIGVKHSMDLPNGFRSLTFNYVGAGNYYGIQWIKIDGMLLIDKGVGPDTGENKVTGSTLQASATDVNGVDGNKLLIDGVSGTWLEGLHIKGSEITGSAPSPTDVVFTSMNGGTTDVTGTDATLSSRVWTLEKSDNQSGPWTQVATYVDTSANASQDGATPWADKPTLEANKYYQVRVKYTSNNANPVESTSNTFKTGD